MLRTLLVFVIVGGGLAAAVRSRYAALLLYLWFAFFRPEQWVWMDISGLRLSLVIGAVLVVPSLLSGIYPNLTHPISIGAIMFLAGSLLGQISAVNPDLGWQWVDYLVKLLVITLLVIPLVNTRERFLVALSVVAGSFGFHAAKAGLASVVAGGLRFMEGPGGSFIDNNAYAVGIAMTAPLLVCVAQNARWRPLKWAAALAPPLMVFAVVGTYSRAGFLALLAGGLALVALQRARFLWVVLAGALALPVWSFMGQQGGYLDRMQTIQTYEQVEDVSALSRFHFWQVAVAMTVDKPLGIGLFNYESAYDAYDWLDGQFGRQRSVHSSHLQAFAEAGVLGGVAWVGLFAYGGFVALRVRRRAREPGVSPEDRKALLTGANAILASMTAFVVGGAFIAMALNDLTWITFGLLASLDRLSAECVRPAVAVEPLPSAPFNVALAPARGYAREALRS